MLTNHFRITFIKSLFVCENQNFAILSKVFCIKSAYELPLQTNTPKSPQEKNEEIVFYEKVVREYNEDDKEIIAEPKETVECIDEGNQSLAEHKPQISGQLNPFENDTPTAIDDRPVEDYVGEGEDRPGEGKHF